MSRGQRRRDDEAAREWKGGYRPYDLVKEASIALAVVLALVVVLSVVFSSPDEQSSTIKSWSRTDPVDFVTTAVSELDGTSGTAGYGPPYNHNDPGQHIAFVRLQKWFGVNLAINTQQDFVLAPLRSIYGQPALRSAIANYENATPKQQAGWIHGPRRQRLCPRRRGGGRLTRLDPTERLAMTTLRRYLSLWCCCSGRAGSFFTRSWLFPSRGAFCNPIFTYGLCITDGATFWLNWAGVVVLALFLWDLAVTTDPSRLRRRLSVAVPGRPVRSIDGPVLPAFLAGSP